jgi:predicted DCC family thiol-disulfide oxidoreductase YuxK
VTSNDHPIVFYDGGCGLCDRSVRWILRRDRAGVFRFAPLQGETYAAVNSPSKPTDLATIVILDASRHASIPPRLLTRSDAVLAILARLPAPWPAFARLGRLVPRPFRDAAYRLVARHRLRLFGGPEACRLPTISERQRLLP